MERKLNEEYHYRICPYCSKSIKVQIVNYVSSEIKSGVFKDEKEDKYGVGQIEGEKRY